MLRIITFLVAKTNIATPFFFHGKNVFPANQQTTANLPGKDWSLIENGR